MQSCEKCHGKDDELGCCTTHCSEDKAGPQWVESDCATDLKDPDAVLVPERAELAGQTWNAEHYNFADIPRHSEDEGGDPLPEIVRQPPAGTAKSNVEKVMGAPISPKSFAGFGGEQEYRGMGQMASTMAMAGGAGAEKTRSGTPPKQMVMGQEAQQFDAGRDFAEEWTSPPGRQSTDSRYDVVKKKPKWRRDMETTEVLEYTSWCWYCLCGGCGCNSVPSHCKLIATCCFCTTTTEAGACTAPLCSYTHHWCCVNCFGELIPQENTPCCLVRGDPCVDFCPRHRKYPGGKRKDSDVEEERHPGSMFSAEDPDDPAPMSEFESAFNSNDACYCCCCGCTQCLEPGCSCFTACCCARSGCRPTPCVCAETLCHQECCSCLLTCLWLYGQCWFIPSIAKVQYNPCFACCGMRTHPPVYIMEDPNLALQYHAKKAWWRRSKANQASKARGSPAEGGDSS